MILTFTDFGRDGVSWYANSCGLVEFAMNQDRADRDLDLAVGSTFKLLTI